MFDTDYLMMVYFHVVSVSASPTAQSLSITLPSPPPSGELTVRAGGSSLLHIAQPTGPLLSLC